MLDKLGFRGLGLVEELYEQQSVYVEEFFRINETPTDQVPADGSVYICENELAVVAPWRSLQRAAEDEPPRKSRKRSASSGADDLEAVSESGVKFLGTGGLDRSIAVYIVASQQNRVGLAHLKSPKAVRKALSEMIKEIVIAPIPASENGNGKSSRSRRTSSGLSMDVYLFGGYEDDDICVDILQEILTFLSESDTRFCLKLAVTGRLNDSHHNGNERDRAGKHCALFTSCVMLLEYDKEQGIICKVRPCHPGSNGFASRGPLLALRNARKFQKIKGFGINDHVHNVYDTTKNEFLIPAFHYARMDHQTTSILVYLSQGEPTHLEPFFSDELRLYKETSIQHFIHDIRETLKFIAANPDAAQIFPQGQMLRFKGTQPISMEENVHLNEPAQQKEEEQKQQQQQQHVHLVI